MTRPDTTGLAGEASRDDLRPLFKKKNLVFDDSPTTGGDVAIDDIYKRARKVRDDFCQSLLRNNVQKPRKRVKLFLCSTRFVRKVRVQRMKLLVKRESRGSNARLSSHLIVSGGIVVDNSSYIFRGF